jgi:hypothetical protein
MAIRTFQVVGRDDGKKEWIDANSESEAVQIAQEEYGFTKIAMCCQGVKPVKKKSLAKYFMEA